MKKLFLVFMGLIFVTCLMGCKVSHERVNVNFIIAGESRLVEIDKDTSISKEIIPLNNEKVVVELYYDKEMQKQYEGKPLSEDMSMYVKVIIDNLDEYLEKNENDEFIIKQGYCNYMNKIPNALYEPNDFNIKYYLGQLTDNKYVVVMENDIRAHITQSSNLSNNWYSVGFVNFKYLPEIISIIYDGEYYDICEAYKMNIISQDDVKKIKYIFDYLLEN